MTGRGVAAVGLGIGGVAVALYFYSLYDHLPQVLRWARAHPGIAWIPFVLAESVAAVFLFPSWVFTVSAGFIFGWGFGIAVASVSGLVGAAIAFAVSRRVAREWIEGRLAAYPRITALDRAIRRNDFYVVLLARLSLLVPYNLLNYACGLSAVRPAPFLLATWIGMLPACTLYPFMGATARDVSAILSGELDPGPAGYWLTAVGVVSLAVLMAMLTRFATRALERELQNGES
jgi:uncharacterized membrane protein YdjX (TVP38/TMEM64 family)